MFTSIISIVALFFIHWSLVLLIAIQTLCLFLIPIIFSKKINDTVENLSKQNESFLAYTADMFEGYETILSYLTFDHALNMYSIKTKSLAKHKNNFNKVLGGVGVLSSMISFLSQSIVFALTGILSLNNVISIGSIVTAMRLTSEVFMDIGNIPQYISSINSSNKLFDKFKELNYSPITSKKNTVLFEEKIELIDVSYKINGRLILDKLNYRFEKNKKYAIIGKSGSGKTTLLKLISNRETEYSGKILIDGKNYNDLSFKEIYSSLLYIDQSPHIFNGTIRENLELGTKYSDEIIWNALEQLKIDIAIKSLAHGLDTYINNQNPPLSKGQMQRLTLSRGLIRNHNLIILDEVTSSLDEQITTEIYSDLLKEKNRTYILVSHNIPKSLINEFDEIIYL